LFGFSSGFVRELFGKCSAFPNEDPKKPRTNPV